MASFSFVEVAKQLGEAQEEGLSFEDQTLTWDTADDVKDIVAALNNTKNVHYLKLGGNTLGIEAAEAIGKALERHPEYRKALWYNMFSRRLKTETPISLKHLGNGLMVAKAQLTVLDLSDNALGPNGMVGIEDLLRSPVCYSLQELRLNNCGLGIGGGQMLSKALLDCYQNSTDAGTPLNLKVFIAGRNRLENDGAKAIAKVFATLKTLEEIVMPQNSIYHVGIAALAGGFKENPKLRILNLNDNTITHKGAASLACAFANTPNLQEINFGDCLLKTNGAYCFAEALVENHNALEIVDLSSNEIGSDGGLVLAAALKSKPHLQKLNLDGNEFGADGCERIRQAMETAVNPSALQAFEEDQSAGEDEDEDDEDEDEEEYDEEDENDYQQDTTEEADEDGDYQDDYDDIAEETAYTTTNAFAASLTNANESLDATNGNSVTFSVADILNSSSSKNNVETFCLSQKPYNLNMFEALGEQDKLEAIKGIIDQFSGDNHLIVLIFTALKCAHLSQTSGAALELAISLFCKTIDYAVESQQERRVLNYLLIQLGLLRSEEKFRSSYDLASCRFALRETLSKQKIASEHMKNVFNIFLQEAEA